jgi:hypothetical protein
MDLVAGMTLTEARERQRLFLIKQGYWERPDGWWIGPHDAAKPLTDEIESGKFVAGDEIAADLMVRIVPLDAVPD